MQDRPLELFHDNLLCHSLMSSGVGNQSPGSVRVHGVLVTSPSAARDEIMREQTSACMMDASMSMLLARASASDARMSRFVVCIHEWTAHAEWREACARKRARAHGPRKFIVETKLWVSWACGIILPPFSETLAMACTRAVCIPGLELGHGCSVYG